MLDNLLPKLTLFATSLWHTLCQMSPYLLLGFLVAGILSVLVSQRWVERHLGGETTWSVIKAALLGVPLPLCSCGVIPVAASLRAHGAGRGATVSFLISTPQTGVDSFFVTWGLLGPLFAIFRPLTALVSGILGGILVMWLGASGKQNPDNLAPQYPTKKQFHWLRRMLLYGFYTLPRSIGWPLIFGILVAGGLSVFFAEQEWSGLGQGFSGMLLMLTVSIPLYVCSTGSVPIAAALIAQGVSPGAAFVFLTAGPATNTATIATVWKVLGKRVAVLYLVTIAATALAFGFLLDYLFAWQNKTMPSFAPVACCPVLLEQMAGGLLLSVLAIALCLGPRRAVLGEADEGEDEMTLHIAGMRCDHCAQSVERALREIASVTLAQVDLPQATAIVRGRQLDILEMRQKIEALGYQLID
jgi:uncharacterized membrane protein YraQ (UPF0718 family)/copper chaperone CopZ